MVTPLRDDENPWAGSGDKDKGADPARVIEVVGVAVHELPDPAAPPLEVRPVEVHELPMALRLVAPREVAPREAVPREAAPAAEVTPEEAPAGDVATALPVGLAAAPAELPAPRGAGLAVARPGRLRAPTPPRAGGRDAGDPGPHEPSRRETGAGEPGRRGPRLRGSRRRAPWLRRRWWALVLCLLAGLAGGVVVTKGHHGSFSAEELLEVRPGNTPANPGGAQEASALAVTYAALVPSDTAVVNALSRRLGVSASSVAGGLSATAESGTGLFVVSYSSPTASKAIAGANEAGSVLASAAPPGLAIVARSVAVVKRATSATKSKDAHLYGLVGGLVGGGLLGIVLVLGLERVDARVDDPEDAAERCGCPATRLPGGMSSRELAVALARLSGDEPLTLVPTSPRARATAEHLARVLATSWPAGERCTLTVAGAEPSGGPSEGAGPTVLVVPDGEPARSVVEVADRLRLMARPPVFSVVCARS